jgi:hypothetical protein
LPQGSLTTAHLPILDVEGGHNDFVSRCLKAFHSCVGGIHQQVYLRFLPAVREEDDLGIRVGHSQADRIIGSPDELVAESVTVERKSRLEIGYA